MERRYKWKVSKEAVSVVEVGEPGKEAVRRNERERIEGKRWVLMYMRTIYPERIVYNYIGVPDQMDKRKVEMMGSSKPNL